MNIENKLIGKPYGICDGHRIYKVNRGHFQIQNHTRPDQSSFDGTKREVERAMKSHIVKLPGNTWNNH